jgi:signal transduction histidine kinase
MSNFPKAPRRRPYTGLGEGEDPSGVKAVDGAVHRLVIDNGRGFVVSERDRLPGNLGLLALNERSLPAGVWTKIESEPGLGTRIEFWMPIA